MHVCNIAICPTECVASLQATKLNPCNKYGVALNGKHSKVIVPPLTNP